MHSKTIKVGGAAIIAALTAAAALPAGATTYTGVRTLDAGVVDLSITTDGATGVLQQSDILSWNIKVADLGGTTTLTTANSQFVLFGSPGDLTATATDLSFNFSGGNSIAVWEYGGVGDGQAAYCLDALGGCDAQGSTAEVYGSQPGIYYAQVEEGEQVIATAGVPEPAAWAMMLVGFGAVGAFMRRRAPVLAA